MVELFFQSKSKCCITETIYFRLFLNHHLGGVMKYRIKLELKKPIFKSDYRSTIVSFFKTAISKYMEGAFYNELYEGALHKNLVWSIKFNKPQFKQDIIHLENCNLEIMIKTSDMQTVLIYYSSILSMKGVEFNVGMDNFMTVKSIRIMHESDINSDFAVFKLQSPLCLREHIRGQKEKYFTCEDEMFALELNKKLKFELPEFEKQIDELMYNFEDLKKTVVPVYKIKIPVTIGVFAVKGNNKILNHILKNGLGSRRNSGFGFVEKVDLQEVIS